MANCLFCKKFEKCLYRIDREFSCRDYQMRPMTNADRIRTMSDEELAQMFWETAACELCQLRKRHCSDNCKGTWLDWLKQEAE